MDTTLNAKKIKKEHLEKLRLIRRAKELRENLKKRKQLQRALEQQQEDVAPCDAEPCEDSSLASTKCDLDDTLISN